MSSLLFFCTRHWLICLFFWLDVLSRAFGYQAELSESVFFDLEPVRKIDKAVRRISVGPLNWAKKRSKWLQLTKVTLTWYVKRLRPDRPGGLAPGLAGPTTLPGRAKGRKKRPGAQGWVDTSLRIKVKEGVRPFKKKNTLLLPEFSSFNGFKRYFRNSLSDTN